MRTPIEALKEIRDRLTYFCLRTDGKYDPPWATELVGIIDEAVTYSHAVGNSAAMRDALKHCIEELSPYCDGGKRMDDVLEEAKAALSEPARNCDRFADELDAQLAFLNEVWLISVDRETMLERDKYENWTDEMRNRYGRWLLAPAAERKGDGDGR